MGWNYVFQWMIVLPLELVVASLTTGYWNTDVPPAAWVAIFLMVIVAISVFGVLGYAEEEFWSSIIKLGAITTFFVIALVLGKSTSHPSPLTRRIHLLTDQIVCGGGPTGHKFDSYWGARLWHDPGAFKNGFKGVCSVFVTAAFAFSGTELVGLAAAEAANPARALPGAIKQIFWRITMFYIVGLLFVGLLVR